MVGGNPAYRRRLVTIGVLAILAVGVRALATDDAPGRIERIDLKGDGATTRVFVMLSRPLAFQVHVLDGESTRRLVIDFDNTTLGPEATKPVAVGNGLVQQIRTGQFTARTARVVLDVARDAKHSVDAYETPPHVTVVLTGATSG